MGDIEKQPWGSRFQLVITIIVSAVTGFAGYYSSYLNYRVTDETRKDAGEKNRKTYEETLRKECQEIIKNSVPRMLSSNADTSRIAEATFYALFHNEGQSVEPIMDFVNSHRNSKSSDTNFVISKVPRMETSLQKENWGIVIGSDKDQKGAHNEYEKAISKKISPVAIYPRNGWFHTVVTGYQSQSQAKSAEFLVGAVVDYGTMIVDINTWCQSCKDLSQDTNDKKSN